MKKVKDFIWRPHQSVEKCVELLGGIGYQATELKEAVEIILKMKKIFFSI